MCIEVAKLTDQRINPHHGVDMNADYEVYNFENEEKETVLRYDNIDNKWYMYSNVSKHITKALKVAKGKVFVDTVAKGGTITSVRIELDAKQVSFRNIVENKEEKANAK